MNSIDTIGENRRMQQIYSALVNYGAESAVDNTVLGAPRRRIQRWVYQLPEPIPELSPAARTRILLEDLGPTYVKMGQIVSSQVNVLPDDWAVQMDLLQNEVPTFPFELARELVEAELGAPLEQLYAEFSHTPLAAASLAQVHRARLHDGREVAVKIQRPNIDRQVHSDLGVTRTMGRALEARST
jgi:ubiquinone biosynthesis protein